jgi:Tol biopolymer transport system component
MTIYYALVDEVANPPLWFAISMESGQDFKNTQLSSSPKLNYTPFLPIGGMYLEYQGLISPSDRYQFQAIQAENDSLYLLDNTQQSKVKIMETPDMNFREAYWIPGENEVVFGIGPEYGTELYRYAVEDKRLSSFAELIGYTDPNISEWALSPNGKYIAILDGNQNLKLFSLDDSFSRTLPGYINNIRWAGNSQKIFYYSGTQIYEPQSIGYFDMATGATVNVILLSEFEQLGVRGFFDVSPDGSQLVFWQAGNIWLMSFG